MRIELAQPGEAEKWLAEICRIIGTPIPEDAVHADEPLQPLQNNQHAPNDSGIAGVQPLAAIETKTP